MLFDYFSIVCGIIKIFIYKICYMNRISFKDIPKINVDFKISMKKGTNVKIGKKFKARHNINIRNDYNGEIIIGNNVFFNDNVSLNCQKRIKIGNNVSIGHNVVVIDHDHDYKNDMEKFLSEDIIIGENVWIGANCMILRGVKIPDNTIIAAGTVVRNFNESENNMKIVYNKKEIIIKGVEQ